MAALNLRAGQLDLLYQDGFIRYIRLGEKEIVRMINHALRDHDWGTVPMEIIHENLRQEEESFQIDYQARFRQADISFDLHCTIAGKADGSIHFHYHGESKSTFKRNRIGFTVLHPITECAGEKVTIVHPDGNETESVFPKWISPHQPFMDIKAMHWQLEDHTRASLFFEGEVFETEDQRNWTDASYKTYCTPLGLPFPVTVKKGEEIRQYIQLQVIPGKSNNQTKTGKDAVTVLLTGAADTLPTIGTVMNSSPSHGPQIIKDLGLEYLRVDFDMDAPFEKPLHLLEKAAEWNIPVELALFTDGEKTYEQLRPHGEYFSGVKKLLLFGSSTKTTPSQLIAEVSGWKKLMPEAAIYAGTDAFFTELNRERVDAELLEGVTYSLNPQVHAFDNASLVETLEAQAYTVEAAKNLYPDKKINISPVSYHMRWNPNATDPSKSLRHPTGWSDPRIHQFFGAGWLLTSLKYLAQSGLDEVAYFELEGENGWHKDGNGQSPMYLLRRELSPYKTIIHCRCSRPLEVDGICLEQEGKSVLLLVNWTKAQQEVDLPQGYGPSKYCQEIQERPASLEWRALVSSSTLPPKSICWFEKG
ncbi:hypothetical protein [Negadavirga shengliensis]|uniref:Uncharacterized protein n=1 Tax=Negadavirga shengliensis TaxID=1389218 RepID=A0ABV9T5U2_9BACT